MVHFYIVSNKFIVSISPNLIFQINPMKTIIGIWFYIDFIIEEFCQDRFYKTEYSLEEDFNDKVLSNILCLSILFQIKRFYKKIFKELDFKSIGIESSNQYYNDVIRVKEGRFTYHSLTSF